MSRFTLTRFLPLRRFFARSAAVLLCLSALLFACCNMDSGGGGIEGLNSDIIGTWTAGYGDHYVITDSHLTYYGSSGDTIAWAGEIVAAEEFTEDDGVIIIKYDADHRQNYYEEWDPVTYEPILDSVYPSKGDYIGIYYNDLVPVDQVNLCVSYSAADGAEQPTLDAAKAEFTAANHGTYAGSQPVCEWTAE